jgi:hypothetical protein
MVVGEPVAESVTIALTAAGFYTETHEFRRGQPVKITTFG